MSVAMPRSASWVRHLLPDRPGRLPPGEALGQAARAGTTPSGPHESHGAGHGPDAAHARDRCPRPPVPPGCPGSSAEAIRGTRPADMITAPRWRRPRMTIPLRGLELFRGDSVT